MDGDGNAYMTGYTVSPNFPTTPGAFQPINRGFDAFVTKLHPSGSMLVYSTYLGGNNSDHGPGIAVDVAGNAYVAGYTWSSDFPTTPGAFQRTRADPFQDAFVAKIGDAAGALPVVPPLLPVLGL